MIQLDFDYGTRLDVVVGGQFGSEAKGHVAADLAGGASLAVRVAGPNAGHIVIGTDDAGTPRPFKLKAIPTAAVSNPDCRLHIAAGSEVNLEVLNEEVRDLEDSGYPVRHRLTVSPHATWLEQHHIDQETSASMHQKIGSTGKGIGAARAERIWRKASRIGDVMALDLIPGRVDDNPEAGRHVVVEGTQGYGLGLHTEFYPKCTSSDCRAIDFLAMAGISPWDDRIDDFAVWVVARTHPIRVAGKSGPLKGETTWQELGLPDEYTTVTNKVRRVGEWDPDLVAAAVEANGGPPAVRVAYTMVDHIFPEVEGMTKLEDIPYEVTTHIERIEHQVGAPIKYLGTGPDTSVML